MNQFPAIYMNTDLNLASVIISAMRKVFFSLWAINDGFSSCVYIM